MAMASNRGDRFWGAAVRSGLLAIMMLVAAVPGHGKPVPSAVTWFEIPVTDMDRAVRFYGAVFGGGFDRQTVDGYDMALFPVADGAEGASGALAKGDVYVPAKAGPLVYFGVAEIGPVLARAMAAGGKVLHAEKSIGPFGFVAEFEDSEGNRIALHRPK